MAKGQTFAIPPSLLVAQKEIIKYVKLPGTTDISGRMLPQAMLINKRYKPSVFMQEAELCALWLANKHFPNLSDSAHREFVRLRKNEIKDGVFLPEFYGPIALESSVVEFTTPTCSAYTGFPNHNGGSPQVIKQYCRYNRPQLSYPLPPPGSGLPNPSPGWGGESVSGTWANEYHAQQVSKFSLIPGFYSFAGQFVFFRISMVADFSTTTDGLKFWASPAFLYSTSTPVAINSFFYPNAATRSTEHLRRRPVAPPPMSPYLWQLSTSFITTPRTLGNPQSSFGANNYHLWLALPPAFGQYFGKNTSVQVSCVFTPEMFVSI